MNNINVVVITGNLTRDPEMRHTDGGTTVCELRVAVNGRRKKGQAWVDKPNFFNVTTFGGQADACAQFLAKGRPVAIEGRLDWSEWEAKDGTGKRQAVQIIAHTVQFLGYGKDEGETEASRDRFEPATQEPELVGAGAGGEEKIPF